jgi:CDP-4-dehydro-6-deoxyglucose reductase/ferredoxin-NAD(P)+ reductase (naphthalene dioxygenase ferredoxin-specific)
LNHTITIEGGPEDGLFDPGSGAPETVQAQDGETILDAALRNGVGFAYSCQAGNCGTCKCEYVSGEIFELEYSEHALSAAERSRNVVLACRTQVWSDVHIRRLSAEEFVVHPSRVMQCRVEELAPLTHDVVRLRLGIEAGGPFTFSAGQFAKLEFAFASDQPRDYSMANRPDQPQLEFHIRVLKGGVSAMLAERLKVGDAVRVSGPFGTSYLRAQHSGPILAIAGGTGLAPIRSIVAAALAAGLPGPIHLYVGMRAERDVYGESELRQWAQRHRNLHVHVVLSEDGASSQAARRFGLVTEAVAADFADLSGFHAYLAGPPAMVDAATEVFRKRGLGPRYIHADAFYSAAPQAPKRAIA